MTIPYVLILTLTVILNPTELNSQFDCLPNGDPIPSVPRIRTCSSPKLDPPERDLSLERPHFLERTSPPARNHAPEMTLTPLERHTPKRTLSLARNHFPEKIIPHVRRHSQERNLACSRNHSDEETVPLVRRHAAGRSFSLVRPPSENTDPPVSRPSPEKTHLLVRPRDHAMPSSSTEPSPHSWPTFSPVWKNFNKIVRFDLERLKLIRLISHKNPNRIFELRRYTFPPNNPAIQLRKTFNFTPRAVPTEEQIVLSTSDGDVYAILERNQKGTTLRGIYTPIGWKQKRVKMNMHTGAVEQLTPEEITETVLGANYPVSKGFRIEYA